MNTEKIIRSIVESSYAGCKVESLDMENNIQEKTFSFAVRIVKLCKLLREQ